MAGRFIMIDLETLGSAPGCSIIAIGAVCSSDDGFIYDTFYQVVSRASCRDEGLHESQDTLDWWARQSAEARAVLIAAEADDAASLPDALAALNAFVTRQRSVDVYGNGSDFDNAILAAAAYVCGVRLAWPFYRNRCYRTIKSRVPQIKLVREGTHHNALDDARSQALHLARLNRAMALTSGTIERASQFIEWMADHFQRCTSRRICGVRFNRMTRMRAIEHACAVFDASALDRPFLHPDFDWTKAGAADLVDEELQHWID